MHILLCADLFRCDRLLMHLWLCTELFRSDRFLMLRLFFAARYKHNGVGQRWIQGRCTPIEGRAFDHDYLQRCACSCVYVSVSVCIDVCFTVS